jgi:aspartate/methionine/tyrosine aminotransferase
LFSSRLRHSFDRNRLAHALERRRSAKLPILDLTASNPTTAGFVYPDTLLAPLGRPGALRYEPRPLGLLEARRAVSGDFQRRGVDAPLERIVLTASTSEAYSLLFKLLCNPGDTVLAPRPSYPLIEHLADLDDVAVDFYSLDFHGRWSIDIDAIQRALVNKRVRAIIVINPNNPTGSLLTAEELIEVASLAAAHDVAIVADEVFADYPIASRTAASALSQDRALTFALGGLSKTVGLPQVKLGWIGLSGPSASVNTALERLETICDTYLSVSTPVQLASGDLLRDGAPVRAQIQTRVRGNYETLCGAMAAHAAFSLLPAEAGWYAVMQIPAIQTEETLVVDLLERAGLLVHPGYFFDFEREAFLILSLLLEPAAFASATSRLFAEIERLS